MPRATSGWRCSSYARKIEANAESGEGGGHYVALGCYFSGDCASGCALWIYRDCFGCGRNCEISLFPVPGYLPGALYHRNERGEKALELLNDTWAELCRKHRPAVCALHRSLTSCPDSRSGIFGTRSVYGVNGAQNPSSATSASWAYVSGGTVGI